MAWETGLGAQGRAWRATTMPTAPTTQPMEATTRPREATTWSAARVRSLAGGLCRDTINCIVIEGSLAAGLYRHAARSSVVIRSTKLLYATQHAQGRARHNDDTAEGGLRHGRCWATIRCSARGLGSPCVQPRSVGCAPCALDPVLTQCTVFNYYLGHCS